MAPDFHSYPSNGKKQNNAVDLMTFRVMDGESKEEAKKRYFRNLLTSREATLTKLIDRCHNASTMAGTFSMEKTRAYIDETREYVFPLLKQAKTRYSTDTDILFGLKYHIVSVADSMDAMLQLFDTER